MNCYIYYYNYYVSVLSTQYPLLYEEARIDNADHLLWICILQILLLLLCGKKIINRNSIIDTKGLGTYFLLFQIKTETK